MKTNSIIKYKYIFGPVPSRRLGVSLGVDLMPHKTCSLNCIYCECGKTSNLTIKEKEYIAVEKIKKELNLYLKESPSIDHITFSGSGEPSLHTGIGEIISFIKKNYPKYKIAILTNSTLFYRQSVINKVLLADIIIASLDAVSKDIFKKINRPHPALNLSKIINGLISLRKQLNNQLWIEVFILPNINNSNKELKKIKDTIAKIHPEKIQINTLDRPGTQQNIKPLDKFSCDKIAKYLNDAETINYKAYNVNKLVNSIDKKRVVLATIQRRPCTIDDIKLFTGIQQKEAEQILGRLEENNKIEKIKLPRGVFFRACL